MTSMSPTPPAAVPSPATAPRVPAHHHHPTHPAEPVTAATSPNPCDYRPLEFADINAPRLTHYLFRFPAKFHPPVAHSLIREYTAPGDTLLDPFCGSGTLLLAAAIERRHSIGLDIDPLAAFVARVKTHRFCPDHLRASWRKLSPTMDSAARSHDEYLERRFTDLPADEYAALLSKEKLWIPAIPNLLHWFRRYVIVDLARILATIHRADLPHTHRAFYRLVFASILRSSSNADPVPVSGLEVTSHMKQLDAAGRLINPFNLFAMATQKALSAAKAYSLQSPRSSRITVRQADATSFRPRLRTRIDAVITSPPYHNAVDYYRRHQLEMFWLSLTESHADRLALLPRYIGRPRVRHRDPILARHSELGLLATFWHARINQVSRQRADAFLHYIISMKDVFRQLHATLPPGGLLVLVIGHSQWNSTTLPTSELFAELAKDWFQLTDRLWYPVKNRYMSYGRHNGADINQEYVLVFSRSCQ